MQLKFSNKSIERWRRSNSYLPANMKNTLIKNITIAMPMKNSWSYFEPTSGYNRHSQNQ